MCVVLFQEEEEVPWKLEKSKKRKGTVSIKREKSRGRCQGRKSVKDS